jgi:glycosyltransferase involved in cell wall biosynthesis
LLIVNSSVQKKLISETFPEKKIVVTPNGQDLNYFFNYKKSDKDKVENVILFYGALSSQFNAIALRRILDKIFPVLKKKVKELKLIVLGSNPPEWINGYLGSGDIEVTGFVDDIRPILSRSYLTLLPLQSGAGFRGRTIELMAMGVPVIGTNNALNSIDLENGKHGFIKDEDDEIISVTIDLLNSRSKRDQVSKNAIELVKEKYTLEATFGKLSKILEDL